VNRRAQTSRLDVVGFGSLSWLLTPIGALPNLDTTTVKELVYVRVIESAPPQAGESVPRAAEKHRRSHQLQT